MAVLNNGNPTWADHAKLLEPDGSIAPVAEILEQTIEGLDYMTWINGNETLGHRHNIRIGLPTVNFQKLYQGISSTSSKYTQVTDTCALLSSLSDVDWEEAQKMPDPMGFRHMEDTGHIMAMGHKFSESLWRANEAVTPEAFTGFSPRFNSLSGENNSDNILDAEGTGSGLTSIWLVAWSPRTVFGIVPKYSTMGLEMTDEGAVWVSDYQGVAGTHAKVYRSYFRWNCGLAVKDWRYVVRIANIDPTELTGDAASGPDLPDLMNTAIERLPTAAADTRIAFYMGRTPARFLRKQIANGVSGSTLTKEDVGGVNQRKRIMFNGEYPVFRSDSLTNAEDQIT